MTRQRLDRFDNRQFVRGRSALVEALWLVVQGWLFASDLPGSGWRRLLLRWFGAEIGQGVVIKPRVRVKFPWRLQIGDHAWIGEAVWIDNLARVEIGAHACVSQGAYFCTGNHDWRREDFALRTEPIVVGAHAWVGAMAQLAPGATLADGAILAMGSRLSGNTAPDRLYAGCPATDQGPRQR
ncbi:colanic acid biosynthesis acetyltransferase WcaF [Ahniella affigens]|uniref:Colanic acid biosynthesis acetyltransferase WcaF n=1 Tax=Ahniella affigens TaxID=2021234 RepID=A0A2P1PYF3_9GAMM|nr:WcaF family extracellular polysaccharide biosynthesis acetyltransferase [Ahniella affigens]AVP99871.1 colanic acid biosynthesis acetyltransferase WcaF [Ahniella affigens]